jgi:hypothetical protein
VQVAGGQSHTLALRSDGTVLGWGHNAYGECFPPPLPPNMTYVAIASGWKHSLALRSDGWAVAFGHKAKGKCNVPPVPLGLTYVEVAGGAYHSLARLSDGSVVAFGDNSYGKCNVPELPSEMEFAELAVGEDHSVARFERSLPAPVTYCTPKLNSLGCRPSISIVGHPSASYGNGCTASVSQLVGKRNGLFVHSTEGAQVLPFHGGHLCVSPPLMRHLPRNSGGTSGLCDGVLSEDFNAYIASGADPALVAGATVWLQAWSRDSGDPFGDSLSDAIELVVGS